MATSNRKSIFFYFFCGLVFVFVGLGLVAIVAYQSLPSTANINDCFKTSMFQVDLCPKKSSYVRFNQFPKHLVAALIAAEDASFYFHKGFDWDEIQDSLEKSLDAGRWVRGGSTLTQQLAKNLYLNQEKSLTRKIKEFYVAKEIEKKLSKTQIIEKYLNVVEFGEKIYGIRSAANHYFQKSVGELSPAESAYLISLLPSPIKYSRAFHNNKELSRYNKSRVTRILSLLKLQRKINDDEYTAELDRVDYGLWNGTPPVDDKDESSFPSSDEANQNSMESMPDHSGENELPALEEDF